MNAPISAEKNSASAESSETGIEIDPIAEQIKAVEVTKHISANITRAVGIVIAAIPRIRPFVVDMATIAGFDMKAWTGLEPAADACLTAELERERPKLPAGVIGEARAARERLLWGAAYLVEVGAVDEARVAAIRSGVGHAGLANGLWELAAMYREHWDRVAGMLPITHEQLERASALSKAVHRGVGERFHDPVGLDSQRTREQAFTLLVRNYEECRAALKWLRRHAGDVDSIAPSLYRRARRARPRVEEPAEQPAVESESAK